MFKRRKPLTTIQHVRELFWPSMGWRRAFRYVYLRIIRLSDSTHRIALGLAIGASISFNPLLGTHFVQAGLLAWFFRANVLCAIIGTLVGNPWTFPFIWWGGIKFGAWIFRVFGWHVSEALPLHLDFSDVMHMMRHNPFQLLLPWTVGGYILGFLFIPLFYVIAYRVVWAGQLARKKAKIYKIHKAAREVTKEHT